MRVRPKRQADSPRSRPVRRPHVVQRPAEPTAAPAPRHDDAQTAPQLREEQRMRAAGGPEDQAFYSCGCGFAFEAEVSTSVVCPHCGAGQAW